MKDGEGWGEMTRSAAAAEKETEVDLPCRLAPTASLSLGWRGRWAELEGAEVKIDTRRGGPCAAWGEGEWGMMGSRGRTALWRGLYRQSRAVRVCWGDGLCEE